MPLEVTRQLAEFAVGTRDQEIPSSVYGQAKLAIADSIGTLFTGLKEQPVGLLRDLAVAEFQKGEASVFGYNLRLVASGAAFANAAAAHALDYDSLSLPIGFVATPILFALLAVAEEHGGISGRELLESFIVGYEVEVAIARGLGVHHWSKGWHSTSTLAHFGAAVAVGRLLKLDVERMRHAIGLAASEASGLRNMMGNMVKVFHMGKAARNGIVAAHLAQRGFTAHTSALEAEWGFCNSFNGPGNYDLEAMLAGLGKPYDLVDPGLVLKVYPCCGLIHSALDGVLDLMRQHGLDATQVSRVRIAVHELLLRTLCFPRPQTTYQARFSAQFCIATALREGALRLAHFTDERVRDPHMHELMQRVEMVVHPELRGDHTFLQNEFTDVSLELAAGGRVECRVYRVNNRGSRGRPITPEELKKKFVECTDGYLDAPKAGHAFEVIAGLEAVKDVREIMACFR
jgi:2-methylcitrate dehydratase PrpD